jgi:hypothetical protein
MMKQYNLIDICTSDDEIIGVFTFQELKEWLIDFWVDNPNEEDTEEEQEEFFEEIISEATERGLCDYFGGIGYYIESIN